MASPPLTDKTPTKIAGMFDAIAGRYDLLNRVLSVGLDRYWRWRAVRTLRLTGGETVLDLCTGTADLAIALARPSGRRRIIGIDFSSEMLRFGQQKVRRATASAGAGSGGAGGGGGTAIGLARGDAMRLPLSDRTVDAVTVAFGIRNVQEPAVACQDMFRVLASGGRLAVLEFAMPQLPVLGWLYRWYFRVVLPRIGHIVSRHQDAYTYLPASVSAWASPGEFTEILQKSGFQQIRAVPLTFGVVYLYTAVKP